MKKICLFLIIFIVCACNNIPKGEVNSYLEKYQYLDPIIMNEVNNIINNSNYNDDVNELYKKVYERQYQDMQYKIVDEKCTKNQCTVLVNIKVYDYHTVQNESLNYLINNEDEFKNSDGEYDPNLYEIYKLNNMLNTNKLVTYNISFHLNKENITWHLSSLDNNELLKLHGLYE